MEQVIDELLLTPDAMARVDSLAGQSGISLFGLMVKAGEAVAAAALKAWPETVRFCVLCGPGNNGGDGYVAAAALLRAGARTVVFETVPPVDATGDAATARRCWLETARHAEGGGVEHYGPEPGDTIIDAVFGAGLNRDLEAGLCNIFERINARGLPVLAVDIPSGINGRTGKAQGGALRADRTVTFMCRKPGHVLLPGREYCGSVEVFDIGIPARLVQAGAGNLHLNTPYLWQNRLPALSGQSHKFSRGHLVVFSGPRTATGAARLAAASGLRTGAGLVTLALPSDALDTVAAQVTAVMIRIVEDAGQLAAWLQDKRLTAFVLGPGFGTGSRARDFVLALKSRLLVLDADGITSFRDAPQHLFAAFSGGEPHLVLTPHEGEFQRLFPDIAADTSLSKPDRALAAARRSNAIVLCKGADTVVASPDGRAAINTNAPPWLATAGSGDVLAGIIGGLLAQNMPPFEAACAGAWFHGEAGKRAGCGLTAEDLVKFVRPLL